MKKMTREILETYKIKCDDVSITVNIIGGEGKSITYEISLSDISISFCVVYFIVNVFPVPVLPYKKTFDGLSPFKAGAKIFAISLVCSSL